MAELTFMDEIPETKQGRNASQYWSEVATALTEQPGRWALVKSGAADPSLASRINRGAIKAFADDGFEATSRKGDRGLYSIYARYQCEVSPGERNTSSG